jgi:hypothetical protein
MFFGSVLLFCFNVAVIKKQENTFRRTSARLLKGSNIMAKVVIQSNRKFQIDWRKD